jgi:hypothetical protein
MMPLMSSGQKWRVPSGEMGTTAVNLKRGERSEALRGLICLCSRNRVLLILVAAVVLRDHCDRVRASRLLTENVYFCRDRRMWPEKLHCPGRRVLQSPSLSVKQIVAYGERRRTGLEEQGGVSGTDPLHQASSHEDHHGQARRALRLVDAVRDRAGRGALELGQRDRCQSGRQEHGRKHVEGVCCGGLSKSW